jgi:hypothetical protein
MKNDPLHRSENTSEGVWGRQRLPHPVVPAQAGAKHLPNPGGIA